MAIQISKEEFKKILHSANQQEVIVKSEDNVKNKLTDLNNHLFAQLERLNDEDLQGEALEEEIKRAKAVSDISTNIINNARTVLEAQKFFDEIGYKTNPEVAVQLLGNTEKYEKIQ